MPFEGKKKEAREFGIFAETQAAQHYLKQGYAILERNWRLGKTEIDIIARKDDTVVMVEVKARNTTELEAIEAVTLDKRKRMIKAADTYMNNLDGRCLYRFDIVTCTGTITNFHMEVYEDAFLAADIF